MVNSVIKQLIYGYMGRQKSFREKQVKQGRKRNYRYQFDKQNNRYGL